MCYTHAINIVPVYKLCFNLMRHGDRRYDDDLLAG
jgi:hypothetical protein